MSDVKNHVQQIAANLSNPPWDEWNEGRDIENEGEFSAFDYLESALDIEYIVSSKGEYLGARVLVAFGGPNIWVNTRTHTVEGHWWGDSAYASFTDNIGLDDALRELSPMMRGGNMKTLLSFFQCLLIAATIGAPFIIYFWNMKP